MIKFTGELPNKVIVACGCGAESMAIIDFLRRGGREVIVAYYHHGTQFGNDCLEFLKEFPLRRSVWDPEPLNLVTYETNDQKKPKGVSLEEYWRNCRYEFFKKLSAEHDAPVITCHHLDDVVETWIWSSFHGEGKIIPPVSHNGLVIRPFLLNRKAEFINWCTRRGIPFLTDPSNDDTSFMRNFIRHEIVEKALVVNPGLHKVVAKKIISHLEDNTTCLG